MCAADASRDGEVTTLAIPGGRRALELSELVRISYAEDALDVVIRDPLNPAAIVVKAAAALDPRTATGERHIQDVGLLLGAIVNPSAVAASMDSVDLDLLRKIEDQITNDSGDAWEFHTTEERLEAQAAYRLLIGKR